MAYCFMMSKVTIRDFNITNKLTKYSSDVHKKRFLNNNPI